MSEIMMPKLSDSMEEGKILRWLKAPGQSVAEGDVLVEVETDKADMEIESEQAGILTEIRLQEGQVGPVGAVIAVLEPGEGAIGGAATERPGAAADVAPPAVAVPASEAAVSRASGSSGAPGRPGSAVSGARVSPLARTRAAELGVDATTVAGTGPGGRVTRRDVEEAHRERGVVPPPAQPARSGVVTVRPPATPAVVGPPGPATDSMPVQRIPLTGMRASIARRMSESKRDAPHFYVSCVVDMEEAVRLRRTLKERGGRAAGVTYNHLVLKACAEALGVTPEMNSRFAGDAVEIFSEANLGVATAVSEGLIVPVIRCAGEMDLLTLSARARELTEKARERNFSREDLSGATFTVSNLGMYDVESFTAVINPPQAGILAVGSVAQRPVVRDGTLAVGHTVHLTVSCDHRAVDGAIAAQFLAEVQQRLENPVGLLLPRDEE